MAAWTYQHKSWKEKSNYYHSPCIKEALCWGGGGGGGGGIRAILIPIEFRGQLSLTPKIIKAVITKLSFTIIPRAKLVSHIPKIISVLSIPHSYSHFARVTCKILNKLLLLVSHVFNARVIFRVMQTACSILSPTQKYCAIARHPWIRFFRLLFHGRLFIDTCMCWATWKLTSFALPLSLPRVINIKFLLQPHQKYKITQYEELGFS